MTKIKWIEERDENVRLLGFSDYASYLQSDLWEHVKSTLGPRNYCCCCSSSSGLAWHHRSYTIPILVGNFSNNNKASNAIDAPVDCGFGTIVTHLLAGAIVRICNDCHSLIHHTDDDWYSLNIVDARMCYLHNHFLHPDDLDLRLDNLPRCLYQPAYSFDGELLDGRKELEA